MDRRKFLATTMCFFAVLLLQGCASASSTTAKKETVITQDIESDSTQEGNRGNFRAGESFQGEEKSMVTKVEKRTEVKEKRTEGESTGVLGTTLHFIGQVLAFPFKLIAGVIEFIF